jgi:isopenicillin-N N-acyltransferase like protein
MSPRPLLTFILCCSLFSDAACAEPPRFKTGKTTSADLHYVGEVPLLQLSGTSADMGEQEATLAGTQARDLLTYAPALIKRAGGEAAWQKHVTTSRALMQNAAATHVEEITAFEKTLKIEGAEIIASQTLYDTLSLLGCSSIMIPSELSATDGPLFGRNLDYVTFGLLHRYNVVKIYRPQGKYAFASVGFPGCFGVLSGMNEHGLALALHEVRSSADDSVRFDPAGVPTMLALRTLLEECKTIDEATAKLKTMKRTTMFNLALCDVQGGAVLEVTTKQVLLRRNAGVVGCTNHFRSDELCRGKDCGRYAKLLDGKFEKYRLTDIAEKLQAVNQGQATFQTMIFEPQTLRLHVSLNTLPSSAGKLTALELRPLFQQPAP